MTLARFAAMRRDQRRRIIRELRRLRADGWAFASERADNGARRLMAARADAAVEVVRADLADAWAHLVLACDAVEVTT